MDFLKDVLTVLCGGGLLTFILAILQRKWSKDDKKEEKEETKVENAINRIEGKVDKVVESQKAVSEAQKTIMVERIRYLGMCYIAQKKIKLEDKIQLKKMYKSYKQLPDANGDLDPVMGEIEKLQVE